MTDYSMRLFMNSGIMNIFNIILIIKVINIVRMIINIFNIISGFLTIKRTGFSPFFNHIIDFSIWCFLVSITITNRFCKR